MDDMNMDEMKAHLNDHMKYPATKQDIWNACNTMSHVTEGEKKMFMDKVPEGSYDSANAVMEAAGMM